MAQDLLFDFTDTIGTDKKTTDIQQQQAEPVPVKDPFSPQREENPVQEDSKQQAQPVLIKDHFGPQKEEDRKQEEPPQSVNCVAEKTATAVPGSDLTPPENDQVKEVKESVKNKKEIKESPESVVPIKEGSVIDTVSDAPVKEPESCDTNSLEGALSAPSEAAGPTMEEVSKNIYELNEDEVDPFGSSNKMQNSPPLPRAKSSGYNINFDEVTDPFGTTKQLANSPPRADPFAASKQLANSPPKENPFAPSKQLANSPPKGDPFAPSKQLANSPPKTSPLQNKK